MHLLERHFHFNTQELLITVLLAHIRFWFAGHLSTTLIHSVIKKESLRALADIQLDPTVAHGPSCLFRNFASNHLKPWCTASLYFTASFIIFITGRLESLADGVNGTAGPVQSLSQRQTRHHCVKRKPELITLKPV